MRGAASTPVIGQIGDRDRHKAGTAAEIKRRPETFAGDDSGMAGEYRTDQARNPIAKRQQMHIEAICIAVEYRSQVLDRCSFCCE